MTIKSDQNFLNDLLCWACEVKPQKTNKYLISGDSGGLKMHFLHKKGPKTAHCTTLGALLSIKRFLNSHKCSKTLIMYLIIIEASKKLDITIIELLLTQKWGSAAYFSRFWDRWKLFFLKILEFEYYRQIFPKSMCKLFQSCF